MPNPFILYNLDTFLKNVLISSRTISCSLFSEKPSLRSASYRVSSHDSINYFDALKMN